MKKPKLLAFAVVFQAILSSMAWGLQLSDIRNTVRLRIRDTASDTGYQRFSDSQINSVINEAQREIAKTTYLLSGSTSIGLVNGLMEYTMPSDMIVPLRVAISSKILSETTFNELDSDQTNWTITTATPTAYYMNHNVVSTTSLVMGFYPKPSTTSFNTTMIFYAQMPNTLSNDSDIPFNGRADLFIHHDILADYATAILWAIQGRTDYAKIYFDLYAGRTKGVERTLGTMPNYNPGLKGNRGNRQ